MKKILLTMAAAIMLSTTVFAQDDNREQRRPRMDKSEMIQKRTERTAKQYGLNEEQAKKLQALNEKYSDTMFMGMAPRGDRRPDGPGMRRGGDRRPDGPRMGQGEPRQRPEMNDSLRAEFKKRREEMQQKMEAYNAELKSIMTEEQFKAYQEDMQKRQRRGGNRQR